MVEHHNYGWIREQGWTTVASPGAFVLYITCPTLTIAVSAAISAVLLFCRNRCTLFCEAHSLRALLLCATDVHCFLPKDTVLDRGEYVHHFVYVVCWYGTDLPRGVQLRCLHINVECPINLSCIAEKFFICIANFELRKLAVRLERNLCKLVLFFAPRVV